MNDIKRKIRTEQRFAELARIGEVIFHAKDLASVWNILEPNTLHTTIKRYIQKGLLFRIYKGMYALRPADQLDPLLLGIKALHAYAYVSCETILARAGIIQQNILATTLVSSLSKAFHIGPFEYRSRKLADRYLYNSLGIEAHVGVKTAKTERAVADMLYFNPKAHLDGAKRIDWNAVKKVQKATGYPIVSRV